MKKKRLGHAMRESNGECHPKTLAPANDHLRSRPATVYEDKAKDKITESQKKVYVPRGIRNETSRLGMCVV